jgi:hypothetical protein
MRSAAARALAAAILLSAPSQAAPPDVPTAFLYQGVLTDAAGEPRTGNVDLKLRIYDAGSGGALLYVQSYAGVALDAGTFSLVIGPTGAAADPPAAPPLTTSLTDVFAGDLAATGPGRWLELQVGTSSALARTRLQATPFALRAGSAETADFADAAGSAGSADSIDGIPAEFVSQLWNHSNFDGFDPPNNDPLEGLADVDGDGKANFIDADNDGDGVNDAVEVQAGKHPNLPTPYVNSATPPSGLTFEARLVTFDGIGFEPGLSATLGPVTLTPQNVTPTSFQASVGPLSAGIRSLTVVNTSGESGQLANAFNSVDAIAGGGAVDVFGAQQVLLGGVVGTASGYAVSTDGDWYTDLTFPGFEGYGSFRWDAGGRVTGLVCKDALGGCKIRYVRDANGNFDLADDPVDNLAPEVNLPLLAPSLVFDSSGRPGGGFVKQLATGQGVPVVFHDRNADGDFVDANERIDLATLTSAPVHFAQAAFDPAGRLAYVYGQNATAANVVIAYDRTGDGDFADAGESTVTSFGSQPECLSATFDGNGHLAVLHGTNGVSSLRRDLNDDADFADAGESTTLFAATLGCALASGPGVDLAMSFSEATKLRLYRDLNGDRDFADADESRLLTTLATPIRQSMRITAGARAFVGSLSDLAITAP